MLNVIFLSVIMLNAATLIVFMPIFKPLGFLLIVCHKNYIKLKNNTPNKMIMQSVTK